MTFSKLRLPIILLYFVTLNLRSELSITTSTLIFNNFFVKQTGNELWLWCIRANFSFRVRRYNCFREQSDYVETEKPGELKNIKPSCSATQIRLQY